MMPRTRRNHTTSSPRWVRTLLRGLLMGVAGSIVIVTLFTLVVTRADAQGAGSPELQGEFRGIGSARGMTVTIVDAGPEPSGRFVDSNGVEAEIGGGWRDGAIEAVLDFPGRPVVVRLAPVALGLQMAVLPLDAEGRPREAERRLLAFLRDDLQAPQQEALYMEPPARSDGESDPDVFLASYQFWPPDGVSRGFSQIGARYRTLIRFFPQLHADVLWKLCDAPEAREMVAEALRGQGATCADVVATVEQVQRSGRFMAWKRAVQADIDRLLPPVQCARGYVVRPDICEPAAALMAERAVSLETVGGALARWR